MGTGHAASGMAAGAAGVAWGLPAVGYVVPGGLWSVVVLGTILAGACLFPDVDHHRATAANAFGPMSRGVQVVMAKASLIATEMTGTKRDQPREHRGLTHTLVFALFMYGLIVAFGDRWPRHTAAVVMGLSVGALVKLGTKWQVSAPLGVAAGLLMYAATGVVAGPGQHLIGQAVAFGCSLHCLGDAITRQGVPFLAPFVKIKGKRWWDLRPPLVLTFHAGSKPEKVLLWLFFVITGAAGVQVSGLI